MLKKLNPDKLSYYPYLIPGALIYITLVMVPFVMNFIISFTKWTGVGRPEFVGMSNYIRLLSDEKFWISFKNILYIIFGMTIVPVLISLVLSVVLFEYVAKKFGNRTTIFFKTSFNISQILPIVISAIAWKWYLEPNIGAVNYWLRSIGLDGVAFNWLGDSSYAMLSVVVIIIWWQLGYSLIIFMAALQRIDPALYEAAAIDGAKFWQIFRRIIIPQILPEISIVVLTTLIHALKVFGPIFALTKGGPGTSTLVPSYYVYQNFFKLARVGYGSAMSIVMSVIIVILTVLFLRRQNARELEG